MPNYRKLAAKQDRRVSEETGLTIEINSGACRGRKGDLKGRNILVETKTLEKPQKTITLKKEWFEKLADQAFSMGKDYHMLVFSFGDNEDYGAMPLRDIYGLYDAVSYLQDRVQELESELQNQR
jgi:hypothetical protein